MKKLIYGVMGLLGCSLAMGATGDISGSIDLRPSVSASDTSSFSENFVELGVGVSETTTVSYLQAFGTNISGGGNGLEPYFDVGFFRARFAPLYKSEDESLTLSYGPRVYVPTLKASREAGQISTIRNYFSLSKKVSDTVTLTGSVIPILHFYSKAGTGTGESAAANPLLENRFYAIVDFKIAEGITLSLPLMFHQTLYQNYQAGAKNNGTVGLFLWTYPELLFAINDNLTAGVAYYSNDLLKADGFAKGVGQLTFQAKL